MPSSKGCLTSTLFKFPVDKHFSMVSIFCPMFCKLEARLSTINFNVASCFVVIFWKSSEKENDQMYDWQIM